MLGGPGGYFDEVLMLLFGFRQRFLEIMLPRFLDVLFLRVALFHPVNHLICYRAGLVLKDLDRQRGRLLFDG